MKTSTFTILALAMGCANLALAQDMPPMDPAGEPGGGEVIEAAYSSYQLLFVDEGDNTLVLNDSYEENNGTFTYKQQVSSIGADGAVAWSVQLGADSDWFYGRTNLNESQLLVSFQKVTGYTMDEPTAHNIPGIGSSSTKLSAIETESGAVNWNLELNGDLYDIVADGDGGWRIQYARYSATSFENRLTAISKDGTVSWDIALD